MRRPHAQSPCDELIEISPDVSRVLVKRAHMYGGGRAAMSGDVRKRKLAIALGSRHQVKLRVAEKRKHGLLDPCRAARRNAKWPSRWRLVPPR